MGSRIRTLQLQARELGRLRSGTYDAAKRQMKRSEFWIVTSLSDVTCEAAAALWGGRVEKWTPQSGTPQFRVITTTTVVDAILPPGDPLSQSYEMWNKGGCARRCDGFTESLSDTPCICRSQYGPEFHAVAPKDSTCKMTTRLNVILPQMPDIGVYRVESHSYYAAMEIAATVGMLRSAAGQDALIPISVRIEPRKRVAGGTTKHFPVVAVALRGATAGQVLEAAGELQALAGVPVARRAIEAARPDYVAQAKAATTLEEWRDVWNSALAAKHLDDALKAALADIGRAFAPPKPIATATPGDETDAELVDGEAVDIEEDEIDEAYGSVVDNCPEGWDMSRLNLEFARRNGGTTLSSGTPQELRLFRDWLRDGAK